MGESLTAKSKYMGILEGLKYFGSFHCFTVHFVSLSFIYTNVCTCF